MKTISQILCMLLVMAAGLNAAAQVPKLNSHPSSRATLFLDFDGHTVNNGAWCWDGKPIYCAPSGLDSVQIREVFSRTAEDFSPFDLNVTTDSTKYLSAPITKRMRVIITTTYSWYSNTAGGVGWTSSFTWGDDTPCFVFSSLHQYRLKDIAEAASHEAGHTLGLSHQALYDANCNLLDNYNWGKGSGEIGWAPIMGAGYSRNFTVWHNGANNWGCDSYQDDLSIITSGSNGFGYRNDDHANTFTAATIPTFAANQFNVSGVIEKNTDQDMFKFIMPGTGVFQLDAIPNNVGVGNLGSDLDMQVSLYSSTQTLLSVYNPGTLLSSLVDTVLNAGTYYLRIEGKGNAYASAYASLGSYSLLGKTSTGGTVLPVHRLQLNGTQHGDSRQFSWIIDADEEVLDQVLEVATDGKNFVPLNTPGKDTRSYVYRSTETGRIAYRVNVMFANGRRAYSNTLTMNAVDAGPHPKLTGNLIRSSSIYVSSPANFSYTLVDFNGRAIRQGQLSNGMNELNAAGLGAGMYVIRFDGNGQQWTEKFIRQ